MPEDFSGEQQTVTPTVAQDATPAASSSGTDANPPASSSGADNLRPEPASMADAIARAFDQATAPAYDDQDADADADEGAGMDADEGAGTDAAADAAKSGEAQGRDKSTTPTEGEQGTNQADAGELPDPTPAELKAMKPATQRRFKQLLDQRRAAQQELAALRPAAEGYKVIRDFMTRNRLSDENVAEAMMLVADYASGDPERLKAFADKVTRRLQLVLEALGQAIPADLKSRVDSGDMTEDAAREFARARHQAAVAETRALAAQQEAQQAARGQTRQAILAAVNAWHDQTRKTDPDFDLKQDAMTLAAKAIVAERGPPRTPAEALQFAKDAYEWANRMVSKVQPQRAATRPTPGATVPSVNRSGVRPAPQTLADAIGHAFDTAIRG